MYMLLLPYPPYNVAVPVVALHFLPIANLLLIFIYFLSRRKRKWVEGRGKRGGRGRGRGRRGRGRRGGRGGRGGRGRGQIAFNINYYC